jgi:adenylate cyclase
MAVRSWTLGRVLSLAVLGLALGVGLLVGLLLRRWGDSLLAASERLREGASRSAEVLITRTLGGAEGALLDVGRQARSGTLKIGDPLSVERTLFALLLANDDLSEVTFTGAREVTDEPAPRFAADGRWQISVYREGTGPQRVVTSFTHQEGREIVSDLRRRPPGSQALEATPFVRSAVRGPDPIEHATFATTVALRRHSGLPLWTDLHYAELDEALPEAARRVVVTVMKVLEDGHGRFAGVVRVGLLVSRLEAATRLRVDEKDPHDPHRIFVADEQGRLVLRFGPEQEYEDQGGDVRPGGGRLPEELSLALAHPALREVSAQHPQASGRLTAGGRPFLLSTLALAGAQDWRVGIVVPEDHYLGDLERTRRSLLMVCAATLAGGFVLFGATLRSVQGSLGRMVSSAARMRDFDFAPAPSVSPFSDVREVLEDLEQAKTALRAMGKYVPIDLVRQLYRARSEPRLGGELRDLSLMFTDIQEFTTLSERLAPDILARALGRYFEAMTAAIHANGGTVDKYIGDAVMALWNAPEPKAEHAVLACAAALSCREATRVLMSGPDWEGLPVFRTRFGLHRQEVMVGHFGAPDRMSYTAIGDGVNLASRLEGLNKAYGTTILASQAVRDTAAGAFAFRLVDVVAVKGRSQGVRIFELRGPARLGADEVVGIYEGAFEAYRQRRFQDALALLEPQGDDAPSRVLADRCRRFLEEPPPRDWQGIHVSHDK